MNLKPVNQFVKSGLLAAAVAAPLAAQAETPKVEFAGLIEASISKSDGQDSQAAVDTVELAIGAQINDSISAEVVLLQEDINTDDQTDLEVDTALINMQTQLGTVSVGKFTVPFTTGETNMIEDATTLVEPAGVGVAFSGEMDMVEYTLYSIDPAKDDTEEITGNTYADSNELGFGDVAGINVNIAFNDNIAFNGSYAKLDDKSGTSGALVGSFGDFGLILETTKIQDEDKARSNIEASYDLEVGTVAVSLQKDADDVDYRSLGYSVDVYENTNLNIQYMQTDDGADKSNAVAAMLAFEFKAFRLTNLGVHLV